jgi:hypothetical protein
MTELNKSIWKLIECASRSELVTLLDDIESKYHIIDYRFSSDRFRLCVLLRLEEKKSDEI